MDSHKSRTDLLTKANILVICIFLFFFLTTLLLWLPKDIFSNGIDIWVYTDWLVDYSNGFTRRGLSGELVSWASRFITPRAFIGLLNWTIFGGLVFGIIRLIARSIRAFEPYHLLVLLFLPSMLPFYLHSHGAFGRKEILGYLIILWHLFIIETDDKNQSRDFLERFSLKKYKKNLLIITGILLPAHVFIHEASFLQFIPVNIIITYSILKLDSSINKKQRLFFLVSFYFPVLIAFLINLFFGQPDLAQTIAICKKWELAGALETGSCNINGEGMLWRVPGAFSFLPMSLSQGLHFTLSFLKNRVQVAAVFVLIFGTSTLYVAKLIAPAIIRDHFSNRYDLKLTKDLSRRLSIKYFLLPVLISIPLYMIGIDHGRWVAISCISYLLVALSREIYFVELSSCEGFNSENQILTNSHNHSENYPIYFLKVVLLLLIIFFVRLPVVFSGVPAFLAEPVKSLFINLIDLL